VLLRAGQSPFEPRLVTVPDGLQTGREPHLRQRGQPRGEPSVGHLDRVWPDTDPAGKSLVAALDLVIATRSCDPERTLLRRVRFISMTQAVASGRDES
jgi:hypothetical protein